MAKTQKRSVPAVMMCVGIGAGFAAFGLFGIIEANATPASFIETYLVTVTCLAYMAFGALLTSFGFDRPVIATCSLLVATICLNEVAGTAINMASHIHHSTFTWPTLYSLFFGPVG